jgi:tRNA U34 5-carboxymethylaminomethyl modifying GTPase MnmE/TrmE
MNGLKISFAVVAFVLIQGVAVIWYVSKLDSRVDQMYKSFEEENKKEVIENQVKMKIDLENLIADVDQLSKDMKRMQSKDKEIVKQNRSIEKQHKDLFKFLEKQQQGMNQQSETKSGGYSYGD